MSLGTGIDITLTAAKHARHLIVEVNDQCPRTLGDAFLHVSKADAIVEASHPLAEYRQPEITEVHRAIARHIASLIPDGATLQTGIGAIPDAVLPGTRRPQGPGHPHRDVPRRRDRADQERGHQQREEDHPSAQGDRRFRARAPSRCSTSSTTTRSSNSTPPATPTTRSSSPRTTAWWPSTRPSRST